MSSSSTSSASTSGPSIRLSAEQTEYLKHLLVAIERRDINEVEAILRKRSERDEEDDDDGLGDSNGSGDKAIKTNWIFTIDISNFPVTSFYGIKGTTILHMVASRGDIAMLKMLVERFDANPKYLTMATSQNSSSSTSSSISIGNSFEGKSPLESATEAVENLNKIIEYIKLKADSDSSTIHSQGGDQRSKKISLPGNISTFMKYASEGNVEGMKDMLDKKQVSIDCTDADHRTAFHVAAMEGNMKSIKFLIASSENSNDFTYYYDRWGNTPFDDAMHSENQELIDYLRKMGNIDRAMKDDSIAEFKILHKRGVAEKWAIDKRDLLFSKEPFASGSGGELYKAKFRGLVCVAKSCINMQVEDKEKVAVDLGNEISMMARLRHPNLVLFLGACFHMSPPILLMEYCEGGTLEEKIIKSKSGDVYNMPLKNRLRYLQELAVAVCFLHNCDPPIVHRDLKPSNVLLTGDDHIKLTDFGISKFIPAKNKFAGDTFKMTGETGSYRYMAPEVFRHENYNRKVDVYSFSFIAYWVVTGFRPFSSISDPIEAVRKAALQNERPSTYPMSSMPITSELLQKCWTADPNLRPDFIDILNVLQGKDIQAEYQSMFWFW